MKKTLSVFIPAYNEEKNIKSLLEQILAQTEENFILEKILVVSDASNDNTENEVRSLNNPKIELIINPERKGKWFGFTVAQEKLSSEIIVSLDGDINISGKHFFSPLVCTLIKSDITAARVLPKAPTHWFQKILYSGAYFSISLFESNTPFTNFYLCHGRCIATTKKCFQNIMWRETFGTDAYMYISAISSKYVFTYTKQTEVYYTLPTNFYDYTSQSSRATKVKKLMFTFFDPKIVKKQIHIPISIIIKKIFKSMNETPFTFFCYLIIKFASKIYTKQTNVLWSIAQSTK